MSVYMQTMLNVADNSGAKLVRCIQVYGGTHKFHADLGEIITVSVRSAIPSSKIKKGQVYRAVIVRTKKEVRRADGSFIKFDDNSVVLVDKKNEPIGSRVFGAIARELRAKKFLKIISLAPEVI